MTMTSTTDLDVQYERIKTDSPLVAANYGRLSEIMKTALESHAEMITMHDMAFTLASKASEHKLMFERALGNTFNNLLVATAKHLTRPKLGPNPSSKVKVIKHSVKVKADKSLEPKVITAPHLKELIHNVMSSHRMNEMVGQGVPQAIAVQALGAVYDPIEGPGAGEPNIWGPVVWAFCVFCRIIFNGLLTS
jgi:hypothetical protein